MEDFFKKFKDTKSSKVLLVVDDTESFRDKYANLAKQEGIDVVVASCVKEGIEKAIKIRPDAIVTDKDMPDGSGSDLAKSVKKEYNVRIAGITGGDPKDFDENYIDIRLSKNISDSQYKLLVNILLNSKDPKKDYEKATGSVDNDFIRSFNNTFLEVYSAVDILVQGYDFAKQLKSGIQPVEGIELRIPSDEEMYALFVLDDDSVSPDLLKDYHENKLPAFLKLGEEKVAKDSVAYNLFLQAKDFAGDKEVNTFVYNLINKDVKSITDSQYNAFHDKFLKMMDVYTKIMEVKNG